MSKKIVFREGDAVRVVTPMFVMRVGYPKSLEDYESEVDAQVGHQVNDLILAAGGQPFVRGRRFNVPDEPTKIRRRILSELAHARAVADGFGGSERSLHFKEVPEMAGRTCVVSRLRTVKTGTYYPASVSGGYEDYDWEPGGLMDEKTHRLAELCSTGLSGEFEIPVYHLEKIPDAAKTGAARLFTSRPRRRA